MIGPAGFMALWLVAATPASATFDIDVQDDQVKNAILHNQAADQSKQEDKDWNAPLPPPKALSSEPGFASVASTPKEKGIPGLPPIKKLPQPPQTPPKQIVEREDILDAEDYGEATCSDYGSCNACDYGTVLHRPRRGFSRWFHGVCWEGWLDQGVTINTLSPRNRSNGPVTFNDRSNDYQLNQLYFRLMRDVNRDGCAWDIGGRVDMLYGTDQTYVTARGLETWDDLSPKWNAQRYGLAMPQCYMEVFAPWGNGWSVKMGHFYSGLGYESVEAVNNFFYSHSYAFQYGTPFTFTGVMAETKLGQFDLRAGLTRGDNNWEDNNNDLGVTGGINWANHDQRTKVGLGVDVSREQTDPSNNTCTIYSLVIQQQISDRWEAVLVHDYGNEPGAAYDGGTAEWYGVASYLFYTINDCWKAGMRFEWFRDQGGARIPGADRTASYFELTPGINWTPSERLIVRSELRWDWTGTDNYYPFGDGTKSNQFLIDFDVIVRF